MDAFSGRSQWARRTRRAHLRHGVAPLAAVAALGACARPGEQGAAAPAGSLAGVTVRYWNRSGPTSPEEVARLKVLEAFNAQNPQGAKVVVEELGVPDAKFTAAIASATTPDLTISHQVFLVDFFRVGATVDVDAELKGNAEWRRARPSAYPNIVKGLSWKDKLYGVPSHNSFFLMYYSPEALKRVGLATPPPRTWTREAFVEYLRRAARPADELFGYDSRWDHQHWAMFLLNNGATIADKDTTRLLIDSPESLETVEWKLSLLRSGLMRPHDGSQTGGYKEWLPEGKVAFQFAVPNRVRSWRQTGIEFGTCFFPLGPKNTARTNYAFGSALGTAVFKNGDPRKVQAALQAGLWQTRPDAGMVFAQDGGVPPSYRHTVESAEFQAVWKKDAESWPFYEALPGFVPELNFPRYWDAMAAVTTQLQTIWAGKTSVRDGLTEGQRLAQQILDESRRGG
jgi:ABC-type glycerol-3-phosphate transport system substrate-binding protein